MKRIKELPGEDAEPKDAEAAAEVPEAVPEPEHVPVGDPVHHEGSTCGFCGIASACGHPQLRGAAVCTYCPWVPNVWVKGP